MKTALLLVLAAFAAAFAWLIWHNTRKWKDRQRAEQERFASFMSGAASAAPGKILPSPEAAIPSPDGAGLAQQKLLFEAARKAGEAGEPALAIQLYARLLARYPASTFAGEARAAVEAQKKKLVKA